MREPLSTMFTPLPSFIRTYCIVSNTSLHNLHIRKTLFIYQYRNMMEVGRYYTLRFLWQIGGGRHRQEFLPHPKVDNVHANYFPGNPTSGSYIGSHSWHVRPDSFDKLQVLRG
jgi:hypothetical protein